MYWPNLKFVVYPVPEIIGGIQKFGQSFLNNMTGINCKLNLKPNDLTLTILCSMTLIFCVFCSIS